MKVAKLLLVPFVVCALLIAGCDNDSSSNAQEPMPDDTTCPCYSKQDVINTLKDLGGTVTCAIDSVGLIFDPGGPLGGAVSVGCVANTSECICRLETDEHKLAFLEVDACLNNMIDAMLDFEKEGIPFGGCILASEG